MKRLLTGNKEMQKGVQLCCRFVTNLVSLVVSGSSDGANSQLRPMRPVYYMPVSRTPYRILPANLCFAPIGGFGKKVILIYMHRYTLREG